MCAFIYIYIHTHTHAHTHTHTCLYGEHACGYKSAESTWPSLSLCLTYSPSNIGSIFISAPPRSLLTAFCDSFDSSRARVMLQGEFVSNLSVCLSFCPSPPRPQSSLSPSLPLSTEYSQNHLSLNTPTGINCSLRARPKSLKVYSRAPSHEQIRTIANGHDPLNV